jgi:hypothetical protein
MADTNGGARVDDALASVSKSGVLKLLLQVGGVSGLIALFLVYTLARDVSSNAAENRRLSAETRQMMGEHIQRSSELGHSLTLIGNLLLQNCVNDAGTNAVKRDRCFSAQTRTPQPNDSR